MKQKETLKAGCILVNLETKKIGMIYRRKQNDYEFPKGHWEIDETIKECAIRETAEETKRDVEILQQFKPYALTYRNKSKERCKCYYFLAIDKKHSDNTSMDTHELVWVDIHKVESTLTHDSTKKLWRYFLPKVMNYLWNLK